MLYSFKIVTSTWQFSKRPSFAGETLAEVWSTMVIDGHPVSAEYISPDEELPTAHPVTDRWYSEHVRESQYLLQVIVLILER